LAPGLSSERIAVVGASAAAVALVDALRRRHFAGPIVLIGDEPQLPYDRPPLSKQVLVGAWAEERLALRQRDWYEQLNCEVRLGKLVVGVDLDRRELTVDQGDTVGFDQLVIATGVRPRKLRSGHELTGVFTLRTLHDAVSAREMLSAGGLRVAVVGGGFLGSEVAASVRSMGHAVTVIYPEEFLVATQLGPQIARRVSDLHERQGVELLAGTLVTELTGSAGRVTGVSCQGGVHVAADVVFVCIGSVPATDWLAGSGIELADGVNCDAYCAAAEGVFAAGDVARWEHTELGRSVRVEHRLNANEQGTAVAANLTGELLPFCPVPFFWTDQYSERIQVYGFLPAGGELTAISGELEQRKFVGQWTVDGKTTGLVAWNDSKGLRQVKNELLATLSRTV
jgi:NADPH-dependent 2,4-dienoyl-CoA reductase/sulfur reductase-like enzyme